MDASVPGAGRVRALRARRPALASFLGVFLATLCCFLAIGAALPVLPRYVTGPIGAGDVAVGIVVGSFAFSAIVARLVGGRLADRRGRKTVHAWGMAISAVAGLLLFLPLGVPGLVLARLVLGFGDGWVFTAGVTWIVDLAPAERRGQAIGMFGLAIWGGLTVGSVLGEAIFALASYEAVWAFTVLAPLVGMLVARGVAPGVPVAQDAEAEVGAAEALRPDAAGAPDPATAGPGAERPRWVPREAVRPGLALALANVGYATLAGFVVLLLDARGIGNGGLAFTAFAAAIVGTRLLLGRLPDRIGARRAALSGGLVQAAGIALLGAATSLPLALAAAVLAGVGSSLVFPSLALLVVARTPEDRRGSAMGAFTAFFDLGVGLGAPFAGIVASLGAGADYPRAFYAGAACCLAGALLGWFSTRRMVAPAA